MQNQHHQDQHYQPDNIFAKIINKEMPAHIVYEDEDAIAIMDIMPRANGHCLVIPKAPSRNILDIGKKDLENLTSIVQKIARAAKNAFKADGLTIQHFCEDAGGQIIFHTHIHILPRHKNIPLKPHTGDMEETEILKQNAEKIRHELKNE